MGSPMSLKTGAGALRERVAFDEPTGATGAFGGADEGWTERYACAAQFIYQSGSEAVQAARLAGRSIYKVRVRSSQATRAITSAYRMRAVRRGLPNGVDGDPLPGGRWNITEVDSITDRKWVHIVVEGAQS